MQTAEYYDRRYTIRAYRRQPLIQWYLRALLRDVPRGTALDVGCGQGQWTHALTRLGFQATGIDVSQTGIDSARLAYPASQFKVMDLHDVTDRYDLIVVRSFTLYNTATFATDRRLTDRLMRLLMPEGHLLWMYNVHPGQSSETWRSHTREEAEHHFGTPVRFIVRGDIGLIPSTVAWHLARRLHLGGDLVHLSGSNPV